MFGYGNVKTKLEAYFHQLLSHMREPLYRNGYALVLGTATTSALGFIYWIIAARQYSTAAIGINSAIISTMTFLSEMSQLNLTSALNRFVPVAGKRTRQLVSSAYLLCLVAGLGASLVFLFGINIWARTFDFLITNPFLTATFILAIIGWNIFSLQDSILIGMRKATWVPVENIIFSIIKLALLVVFVWWFPIYGVFLSWILPLVAFVPLINILIYYRLIPQHVDRTKHNAEPIVRKQIAKYIGGNYFSNLLSTATASLIPLLILAQAGASANAYYYISWTVTYSLYLVSYNMGMSFITEATSNRENFSDYRYRTLLQTALLLTPIVILLVLGAPILLRIFGASYANEGLTLFRLLCLSALPKIITTISVDAARVEQRMRTVILVPAVLGGWVLTFSVLLLNRFGITGVGIAWFSGQTILALFLLLTDWRKTVFPLVDIHNLVNLLAFPRNIAKKWQHRKYVPLGTQMLQNIDPEVIKQNSKIGTENSWKVRSILSIRNDLVNIEVGPDGNLPLAIIKIPKNEQGLQRLNRHYSILKALQENSDLEDWRSYLPQVLTSIENAGLSAIVERIVHGVDAGQFLSTEFLSVQMKKSVFAAIHPLHQKTAFPFTIKAPWLESRLETYRNHFLELLTAKSITTEEYEVFLQLENQITDSLIGRQIAASWIHGDFTPHNIVMTSDGVQVVGLLDWEMAVHGDIPQLDLYHFLIVCRSLVTESEYGESVSELLNGGSWTPFEEQLLASSIEGLPGDGIEPRLLILLCWLSHISNNLAKTRQYHRQGWWIGRNIRKVLRHV